MKIGFDAKRFFHNNSGLGNYSRDLIRILATHFSDDELLLFARNKSEKGADILNFPNVSFQKISKGKWNRQLLMGKDAQNQGCGIFHGLSGELPLKWNSGTIKKVVTIHDLIFLRYPQYYTYFDRQIHTWKFRKACKEADLIIAISKQTQRDLQHYFKIPEEKVRVVYQSCHQAFKNAYGPEDLVQIKEKYNLPASFLLSVGTIEERKNLLSVVKAIEGTEIPLVVVGKPTDYARKILRFLEQKKMQKQVFFLKNVSMEELAKIYQLAHIFIYPSLYEGFGIPVIEALFSKTPVITSNTSCLPEAGGPDSMYVQPLNVEDIRAKILHLWENPQECKRRAERSFEYVQKFNEEKIAREMQAVYKELLEK